MFSQLHLKHPHVKINNEVVEPSNDMLHKYKGTKHFIAAHLGKSYYTLLLTLPVNGYLCCFSFFNSFSSVRVSTTPGLDHINFAWNKMTASEFEKHWQEKTSGKKMDFIHMIQVLTFSFILSTLVIVI